MFPRTAQAPCRLTARRHLALGGLAVTSALLAGAFVSTPAFAVGGTEVHTFAQLDAALTGSDTVITVAGDFDGSDKSGVVPEDITSSKTLDLNGQQNVNLDQTTVADGVEFDVIDSTAVDGSAGNGSLFFNADGSATTATPGVQLGDGAALHISGATVYSTGADGGAGVGATSAGASLLADDGATVWATGSDHSDSSGTTDGGGAGIGGSHGATGFGVTIGNASVTAIGGAGAAGVGGGDGGDGGAVHLEADGRLQAQQGARLPSTMIGASSIGGGSNAAHSGALTIDPNATLQVSLNSPLLLLPATGNDPDVVNNGSLFLDDSSGTGDAIDGSGTIANHGSITAGSTDPSTLIGSHVGVTGYNYDLTVDPNGGTIAGAHQAHLYSGSVSGLVPFWNGVTPPSDDLLFWKWTTQADGSGTIVPQTYSSTDDLAAAGTSTDGSALPVTLYAQYGHAPQGTADSLPDAVVGSAYDQVLPISGDGITSYQVAGPQSSNDPGSVLPAGLSLDSATGRITGTPTEAFDGDVTFDVTGVGENLITFHFAVGGAPVFATTALPSGTAGEYYSAPVTVGGSDDTAFSIVAGALPDGLRLSTNGTISGTPSAASSATFTVRATSRFGSTDRAFTMAIGAAAPTPSAPVLGAAPHASVKFGRQLTLAVTADSTSPVTFKLVGGALPHGVTLNAKTGVISGAPVESGTFTVFVRATNSAGSTDAVAVITVSKPIDLIKAKPVAPVAVGAASVPVKVAGLKKGEHWTVRLDGKVVAHGTMRKAGTLTTSVHLAKASKDKVHTIVVSGSRKVTDPSKRAATVLTVTSLSATKALHVWSVVDQRGVRLVAVEKLAPREHVVVTSDGKVVAKGQASEYGIFTFVQSKLGKGTHTVVAHGATAHRAGTVTVHNAKR